MRYVGILLCLLITWQAGALPLSQSARQEAELFNTFLQAVYAQRQADPARFSLLQKTLEKSPSSSYIKQQLVSEALAAEVPQLAEHYIDFIQEDSPDADAWVVYAMYQWNKGNAEEAVLAYEKALALEPDDEQILYQYVTLLVAVDPDKAIKALEDLATAHPMLAPEVYTEIGRIYVYQKRYPQALASFNKAIELSPAFPDPRLGKAQVYEKTNQYFFMLHELEELEKMGAASAQTLTRMGSVFVLVKDMERAEQYFLKAKARDKGNIAAGYFLAVLAEQREEYEQAISYLQESEDYAISAAKQIQVSYYQRKLGNPKASLATLAQAYRYFPDNEEVQYLYAVALCENDQFKKAVSLLTPLVTKYPQNQEIRLQYAFALEGQKKYREMEETLQILLEQNPRQAAALNLWAYSLALRNTRLDEAADYAARALSIWPQDLSLQDTQAWIFYLQGKYDQAADLVGAMPESVFTQHAEIAYHAGMICLAQGQTERARTYLELAAEQGWKAAQKQLKKLK